MSEHDPVNRYLTVRQVAEYLHINQKKVYALAADGALPGTRATGKWLFPRELVDQWLLQTSHGGALMDLLLIGGAGDRLMRHLVTAAAQDHGTHALICYSPQTSRAGLAQLDRRRLDATLLHWGPAQESERRHAALLQSYAAHTQWSLVHLFRREQGLLVNPALQLESAQAGRDHRAATALGGAPGGQRQPAFSAGDPRSYRDRHECIERRRDRRFGGRRGESGMPR